MNGLLKEPRFFRHFKGNYYRLIAIAKCSESGADVAIYQGLYGDKVTYSRPMNMFTETIQRNGKSLKRFEEVPDITKVPEEELTKDHTL